DAAVVLPTKSSHSRRRRRYVLWAVGLAIVIPLLSWGAMQGVRRQRAQQILAEAVAAVDRMDSVWRLEDLEAARPSIADEQNPALVVMEVRKLRQKPWEPVLPSPLPQRQLKPEQATELQAQLQPLESALAKAATLSNPSDGRFPAPETKDPLAASKNCEDAPV